MAALLARSAAPLLLLSVLASTAAAARTVGGGGGGLQEACSKTQFPKVCSEALAPKPECKSATPRKLAETYVNVVGEAGTAMAAFVNDKLSSVKDKDDALFKCFDSCSDDVEEAVAHLSALTREPTDAKFLEVKSWLSSTLGGASTCEDACKDAPKGADKDEVVNRSLEFEKQLRVTLDLITEASGSMSAADVALPPSAGGAEAPGGSPAYGSAAYGGAPFGAPSGGDSGSSAESPAASGSSEGSEASADAPSSGGSDAEAPSSGGSDAEAPSSGGSDAEAPSSGGSDGKAPSSAGGYADAPEPSAGGSDSGADAKA
ncbi:hypothetical protein ACP70R_023338 [Stipagrostis hirtigluma subsp. patula]